MRALLVLALLPACGGASGDDGDDDVGADASIAGDGATCCDGDVLSTATGCAGVYNPDQVLDFHLTMANGDWSALKSDTTNSVYYPAELRCNDDPPLPFTVAVRRKRSGGQDKPALKIDFNELTPGADFQTLKKLSLENGVSEGSSSGEMRDVVAEYLAWRMMTLSGAMAGRAAFARVFVNGDLIGVYVDVEQVDKRFLRARLGDDSGWLYKKSGSADDGYKTNETTPNPYEEDLCFWSQPPCPVPDAGELETYLPMHLDIEQMLRFGGVNALIANSDSPLGKDNNYCFYDHAGGPRVYFPWDLDTTMKDVPSVFEPTHTGKYMDVLFTHWEDDYDAVLTAMLDGPLALPAIEAELDRIVPVAGSALDADPQIGGDAAETVASIRAWWTTRHAQVTNELEGHAP